MRKLIVPVIILGLIALIGCSNNKAASTTKTEKQAEASDQGGTLQKGSDEEVALIKTKFGDIVLAFYDEDAPQHVANFKKLAREGFYNGCTFHRVIPGFMIQGGDPNSKDNDRANDGLGGPGYTIPAEIKRKHKRGALAAARKGDQINPKRASSGSQFYICVGDPKHLDGAYTVFGETIDGFDVIDEIASQPRDRRDNPTEPITMTVEIRKRSEVMGMD
jgi:cyclophilin family peptidyl-prolyl cis-trans isomerase